MATSSSSEIKNTLSKKARKLFSLFLISILSIASILAQPVWVPTTPSIPSTGALSITANYGINVVGTVYITVVNFDFSPIPTSAQVKAGAIAGPAGGRVATAVLAVNAGNINLVLNTVLSVINANTVHSVFIVAQNGAGVLQAVPIKILCTTKPCPDINIFTFFGNTGDCVNLGASGMFQAAQIGALPTGVLKGTRWTIDWGDGSAVWQYISTADNDIPGIQLHSYINITTCNYVGTWTVQNPCGKFANASNVFVVHGRDIPTDGDGLLRIEEIVTHTPDIIYVCEGAQHNITLADISTWNCQNPVVPFPLTAKPNIDPRTIQFTYGQTPAGVVMNTITGNVLIAGIHIANGAGGWDGPVITPVAPPNPNTQTDVITIPATCLVGQRFYVYIKNWNKCNPYASNPALGYEFQQFIIEVIDAPPAPIVVTPQNYCFNAVPLTLSATPNLVGNTINWYADAGLTTFLFTGQNYVHGQTLPGTYNYWATETSGVNGCEGPASQITMFIRAVIANNTVAAVQTICNGQTPVALTGTLPTGGTGAYTYLWERSTTSAIAGFAAAPGVNNTQNYTPGALVQTTWYRRTVTSGPCSNTSPAIQITVLPTIANNSVAAVQTICNGQTPVALTGTLPTGGNGAYTYLWESSTTSAVAGFAAASGVNNTQNYTPGSLAVTTWYRRTVTSGQCTGAQANISPAIRITVLPLIGNNTVAAVQTICNGQTPVALTGTLPTGGSGAYTYLWQRSTTSAVAGFAAAPGVNNTQNYTPGVLAVTTWYRRTVTSGACSNTSAAIQITVLPAIANNTVAAVQTICNGQTPVALTGTLPTGGNGVYTYLWESSTTSAVAGFAAAAGVNNTQNYTPGALAVTTWYRRTVTSGQCTGAQANISPAIQITVLPLIGNNTVAAVQTICNGQTPVALTGTAPTGGSGAYIYLWESSTTSAVAGFAAAAGVNNTQNYTPGALAATTWYRRTVTSGTCSNTSPAIQITVLPLIGNNTVAAAQTICNGQTPVALTGTIPTGGSGAYTYLWERSTTSAVAGFAAAPGVNNTQNYTPGVLAVTTWYRRTVTSGACSNTSAAIQITVLPAIANNTVAAVQTICNGQTPVALTGTLPTGGNGVYTYLWESSTTSAVAGFAAATGVNNTQDYTPGALAATTWYRRTVTSGQCTGAQANISPAIQITVLPLIGNNTVAAVQTICNGQTPVALTGTFPTGGSGAYIYLWESSTTSAVAGFAAAAGINNTQNYTPGALAATTWYRRTVTSGTCSNTSAAIQITVLPALANNIISADQSICNNTTPAPLTGTLPTGGTGVYVYLWESSIVSAVAGFGPAAGANSNQNYTPLGLYTQTTWFRRTVTSAPCSGAQGNTSSVIQITVGSVPTTATLTGSGDACFGPISTIKSVITGGAPPYTINYTKNGVAQAPITPYTSNTNYSLLVLPVGTYNYQIISVADNCGNLVPPAGLPPVYTITISGNPVLTSPTPASQTICNDASASFILNSTVNNTIFDYTVVSVPAVGYSWTAGKDPVAGTITDANGDGTETLTRQLKHNYTSPVTVTYTITPKGPGATACPGASINRTVIVEPTLVITSPNKTICDNTGTGITVSTSTTTSNTTYYKWTLGAVGANISGAAAGGANGTALGTQINQTLDNSGTTAQTVTYIITPWTGTAPGTLLCSGASINVVVTVEPTPVISSPNKTICDNTGTGITVSTSTTTSNTTYYKWTLGAVGANISGATAGGANGTALGTQINQTLDNSGTTAQTVTYIITPWTGTAPGTLLCSGAAINVVVTVEPTPVISSPNKTICDNTGTGITVSTSTTTSNTTYYKWTLGAVGANISGAAAGGANGTALGTQLNQTLDNSGTTAQTVTYIITPWTGTAPGALLCSGASINVVVTVEPTPVISSPNKTICDNTGTGITVSTSTTTSNTTYYKWTLGAVGANISGATAGGANGTALGTQINQTLDNSGTTAQTVTYIITPWTGTAPGALLCSGAAINVVVTVEPTPVISSPNKTICDNTGTGITVSTSTTTSNTTYYKWTLGAVGANISGATAGGANGTALGTQINQTLDNSGTTAQTVTYIITPWTGTAPGALLCSGASINVVVTVEPTPVITSPDKTICDNTGTGITVSTSTTTSNTTYYKWTLGAVGANISGATAGGANGTALGTQLNQTLDNSGTTAQTVTYIITPWTGTAPGALLCSGASINVVVTVEPTPVISSPNKTICDNTGTGITVSTSTTTSNTTYYKWTLGAVGANISGATAGGANGTALGTQINQTLDNSGTTAQTVTYIITPWTGTAPGTLLCSGAAINVVVTVEPTPVISSPNKTICDNTGTGITVSTSTTTSNTTYYKWTLGAVGANISGATAGGANGTALGTQLNQTLDNSGTTAQTVTYIITPWTGTAPGALLCSGASINVVVTVEPTPVISSPNKTICDNTGTGITVSTSTTTSNTTYYKWTLGAVGANISGATAGGANGTALGTQLNQTLDNSGTTAQTVTYIITPWTGTAPGTLLCSGAAINVVVTVEPTPVISSPNKTICDNTGTGITVSTSTTTSNTTYYKWTLGAVGVNISGATAGGANGTALGTQINQTLDNSGTTAQTVTYIITPWTGTAPGALLCSGASINVVVTVEPTPVISSPNKTICDNTGTGITVSTSTTTSNTTYYKWTLGAVGANISGATAGGANGTALGTQINQTLDNSGTTAQTVTYIITPWTGTAPGALLCSGASINVVVTVEPTPVISSPDKTICDNTSTAIVVSTSTTTSNATYYKWTVSGVGANIVGAAGGPATGTLLATNIAQILDNTGSTAQTVTYNITPWTGTAPGTLICSGAPIAVVVTVEPTPVANIVNSAAIICSQGNTSISITSPSTTSSPLLFDYTVSSTNPGATGGTAYTGGSNVTFPLNISGTITSSAITPLTVTYTVTPKAGLCSGVPVSTTVTVNPVPVISPNSQTICSNNIPSITAASNIPGTTFTWSVVGITGSITGTLVGNSGTGAVFTETLRNPGAANGNVTYRFTPTAPGGVGGCAGSPVDIVITVQPEPVGSNAVGTVCSGNALNYSLQGNINGNNSIPSVFTYTLVSSDPAGVPPAANRVAATNAPITDTYANITGLPVTITYTITPASNPNGCTGSTFTYTVTVNSQPVLDNLNKFACNNASIGLTLQEAPGSVVPSEYSILSKSVSVGLSDVGNAAWPNASAPANYLFNDKYTNTTAGNLTVTYRVQPILAPSCIGAPKDIVITVYPPTLPGTITGNTSVCYNTDAPVIGNTSVATGGDGVITYSWYYTNNLAAVPGDLNWTLIPGATLITYDPGILVDPTKYVRKAIDGSCTDQVYTNMITIGINPLPVTSAISGPALLCAGATNRVYSVVNTAGSTYAWTVPAALNVTSPPGLYFIIADAVGLTVPGDKIQVVETFSSTTGCVGLPVQLPLTISPTIPGVSVTGPLAVCNGDAGVVYSVPANAGSTYSWVVPAGASITSTPDLNQISVNFSLAITGPVSVVETSAAGCVTVHNPITVVVNPLPTAYNLTAPAAYCTGDPGVTITLSNSQTGVNYQLYNSLGTVGAPVAGTNGSTLTWTNMLIETYHVIATNVATGCTAPMNGTVVVTINLIIPGSIGTDQTICESDIPVVFSDVASGSGGGAITYQWQNSTDNITYNNIAGATSATYGAGSLIQDTWYRRTAISNMGTSACPAFSNIVKVTVNNFLPGSIAAAQTINEGGTPAAFTSVTPTGDGAFTYQWKESIDGITFTDITGATLETYAAGALAQDTWYKRIVTSTLAGKSCVKETNIVKVTVINFLPGSIAADQTICEATAPAAFTSVPPTGDGLFTYQWQSSPDNTIWTDIAGATSATYAAGALAADTWYKKIVTSTVLGIPSVKETNIIKVTVNNFVPGSISADQTICEGDTPAAFGSFTPTGDGAFTYQWQNSLDGITYSNITGAASETYSAGALITDTWFRRLVTSTLNGSTCALLNTPVKVTVVNFTPGTISVPQTICEGGTPAPFTATAPTGEGAFIYQWQSSNDGTTFSDIAGATVATYAPGILIADTWYKRVVTSTLNTIPCVKETNVIKVTVNNFDPGSIGTDETICDGTAPSQLTSVTPTGDGIFTYKWYNSADGSTFVLIPGAIGETYSPSALSADTWYKRGVTSTFVGVPCTKETNIIKITVNNLTPGSISADQTICDGASPVAFTSGAATADGTISYQWKQSTDGLVFTDIAGATLDTYAPGALTQDTWYKREVTSDLLGRDCILESNLVRVTVINFLPGSISSDQTICNATAPASFTSVAASGDGVKTYQWQSSPDNSTWTSIPGATLATYTAGALISDIYYRRLVTATLNGTPCVLPTNSLLITVNSFVPGSILDDQTICEGDTPAAFTSVSPAGDGTITYQWQSSLDGISFSNITGATSETFGAGALMQDTWYRRQVTSTLNGNTCTIATNIVRVTVVNFNAGSISASQTICEGSTPVPFTSVLPAGEGTFTYQWQTSIDGAVFADIAGATLPTYAPGVLIADTWYKRVVTSTLNTIPCVKETNVIKITVNNFDQGSIGTDITICEGDNPSALTSVTPTGDGVITYKWQNSTDNGATYNNIAGAISETYDPGILIQDTWYKRVVTSTLNGNICTEETNIVKITVNNFLPGSITGDQTICEGDIPAAFGSVIPTGDGTFGYQWQISTNGFTFTDIAGATLDTYADVALTQDTWYKRIVTSTLNGTPCAEETNMIKVTVINFVPGSIAIDQTICNGTVPATFTSVAATGDGVKTYQWQDSPDGITFTNIAGAVSATYTSVALTSDTYFRRVVTSTLNGKACVQPTNSILVTVNNFVPGSIADDQTICEGDTPAAFTSVTPTGDGTLTYQWQISLDGISFSNITGATSETFGVGALTQDTWYRRQVTSTLNGNTCTIATNIVRVTVVNFNAGSISASQTICEGSTPVPFTSVLPAGEGTFTYQWQTSIDGTVFGDIAGATLPAYAPGVLIADTWYKRIVTSTLNTIPCIKETNVIKVTVNNFAEGSIGADQTICDGTAPAPFTSVSPTGDGSFTYQWRSSTDNITYSDIPGAVGETYNAGILTQDTWYKRVVISTLSANSCIKETNIIRVTVINFTAGSILSNQTICDGDIPASFTSMTPTGDGTFTYQWRESPDGITFSDIAGATGETYAPPALTQDTWYKRIVTSTLNGTPCTKETNLLRVTVINFNPGGISGDQTICEATVPATFTSVAPSGDGVFSYQWQDSPDGITFTNIAGANSSAYTAVALITDTWYRRVVTATLNGTPCVKTTNIIRVTINIFNPGTISADQTICEGSAPVAFTSLPPAGAGTFTYQWQSSLDGLSFVNITGATSETFGAGILTQDTWYRRQVTSTLNGNTCTIATNPVKITVNNFNAGSIAAPQTICEGIAPAAFTSVPASGDGTFTYQWQTSIDGTVFGDMAGATLATYAPGILIVDTWYKRIVTSTLNTVPCIKETNVIKVTVNNFSEGSIGSDQTICDGTAPLAFTSVSPAGDGSFTYQWKSSTDNITYSDIPGAVGETYNAGILTQDTWYKRVVISTLSANSCIKETNIIRVTVINFAAGSILDNQTICDGAIPAPFTGSAPTGDGLFTYQWKNSPDGVVFNDIAGATADTYSPPALTADTWYKRVVTSTLNGTPCIKETNMVRVTVINFAPGSISVDQTICNGSIPATFTSVAPSGDGVFSYQWQDSPDGLAFTNIAGATSSFYTSVALNSNTWFKRVVTSTLNGTQCVQATNVIKVTVINFIPGSISNDQTICESSAPAPLTGSAPSGDGTFTFQWQSSLDGVNFSNLTGATLDTYAPGTLVQDTWYRLSVTSTLNGIPCSLMTNIVRVTVINFTPGTISGTQAICDSGTPAPFTGSAPTGDGIFTFQWQSSTDGVTFGDIAGQTAALYAPGPLTQDTWYKRIVTSTLNAVSCIKETNVIKVTVDNFLPGAIAADQTICDGSFPAGFTSATPTGDGAFTYQWQSSTDGITFNDIAGAIFETFNSGALLQDTWYKRKVTSTIGINSCMKETNIIKVTVNNFIPGSISTDQTICEGGIPAAFTSVTPTGDGVFTYRWRSSPDGLNFLDIAGAVSETFTAGALTQDTWFKRVVISTLNGISCTKETGSIRVSVNNVSGGTIISDQTICSGSDPVSFMSIVNGSGDGIFNYQWQISSDGSTFNDIAGANATNYDAGTLTSDTWYKRITKSVLNAVECTRESNTVKITINSVTGGVISAAQTICYSSTPAPLTSTDDGAASGTVTYQWLQSDNNVIFFNIPGATTFGYAPGALLSDKYYKRVIISILNGILCTSESNIVKITVNPLPVAMLSGGETICPAQSSVLRVTMPVGTGPFTVDIENYPGVTITGYVSGADITVSPVVTTTYRLLRVLDANGCEVLSPSVNLNGTATVVVSIVPTITTFTPSPAVCEFSLATFRVTATGTNLGYQWFVDEGSGFIPAVDGGTYFGVTTSNLQIFNSVRTMNGYIYHVVVSGCSSGVTSADATLVINTAPELTVHPSDSTVCLGSNATMEADATGTNLTWQWYVNKGAGFVLVTPDANFSGETTRILTITNAQFSFNNWIFRAKVTGICGVPAYTNFSRLSVINPPTAGLQPVAKAVCENGNVNFLGNGSGYTGLQWQVSINGGTTWTNITDDAIYVGSVTNQLSIFSAPATFNSYQYRLGLVGTCTTTYTNAAVLTVNPNPVVNFPADLSACGGMALLINGNPTGGTAPYTQHRWTGDVGPLSSYTIQSPTFNSQISGDYNINYKVTDSKGCTANDDVLVTVDSPSAEFTKDVENGCTPLTVAFTKDMTGIASYSWDFGDGSPVETAIANPVHTFTNANASGIGYYNVSLTVNSPGGCPATYTSTVTVYPAIDATFTTTPSIVCSGNPIVFTTQPGASKYFWNFGDGVSGYFTNITNHLYTNFTEAPVVHTVTLTTTSFYSCTDMKTMDITVMPTPLAQFTAFPVSQIYSPAGNPVTFTNTTNPGSWTWLWNFGDGATSTTQNPGHTYTGLGTFIVQLKVSNANCSDSVTHQVTVTPPPPVAKFDPIPSGCSPLEINVNNTSLNTDTPGTTYMWDFGDGTASTSKNPSYTYFNSGVYRVELTVTGPGGTSNFSQVVSAYPSPLANFQVSPIVVFANDEPVRCYNLTQGADSYLWEFGDGDTSKVKEPFHRYMEEGVYDITLWAYIHNVINNETVVCSDKYVLSPGVTVEPNGVLRFSTVFTPNKDGAIDMDHLPTGGVEMDQFFFPPIREKVTDYKLQVFNRLGVLIFESHDINRPWNGYYHNKLCQQGVYVWYVEGKYANGTPFKKVGDVTLLH